MNALELIKSQKFQFIEMPDHLRKCPMCGQFLKFVSKSKPRKIRTLKTYVESTLLKFRCNNRSCTLYGDMYDPYSIALPNIKVGKDVLLELLILKFHKKCTISEIKIAMYEQYRIDLKDTTIKRYVVKAETLIVSNIQSFIPRIINTKSSIIINMDYIEPKAKRHKIFFAFEHDTRLPILYKILDVTNEVNIRRLIKQQVPQIQDVKKIYVSDADTSLLFTNLNDNANNKHQMCVMHFNNICFKLAKSLDEAAFSILDDALSMLWVPIKKEKDELNKRASQFDILDPHDAFGFMVLDTMNAILEIKNKKGKCYKSERVNPFVQELIARMDKLDPNKTGLGLDSVIEAVTNVKCYLSQNKEYFIALEKFSRDLNEIRSIIKNESLNSKQTEEQLISFAESLKPPEISLDSIERRPIKRSFKKKSIPIDKIWEDLKDRVQKYAKYLSTLKDYTCKDLTNNTCENRFSVFRSYLRLLMGFKDHSSHEYLNAYYYFNLTADLPCNINLYQLSCYHTDRFKKYFEVYKEGCRYYNRFHNKPKFIHMMFKEMEKFMIS